MSHSVNSGKRALAAVAAAALGLGGLAFSTSAAAAPENPQSGNLAPTTGSEYEALAKDLLNNPGVQAVGKDSNEEDANIVVLKKADTPKKGVTAMGKSVSSYDNVTFTNIAGGIEPYADTDVVGGAGYFASVDESSASGASCSIGFTAWSPEGDPAAITAGHCTDDGAMHATGLTLPTSDQAGGGPADGPVTVTHPLGSYGFSQYGGPGNTTGGENTDSIDVAVIDVTNGALTLKPEVTDWTTAASDDLSQSTTPITAVGTAQVGQAVCKSGRTTGHTCDPNVDLVDGWANVGDRVVYGFGVSGLVADHGDSGGSVYSGGTALGILSGGTPATGDEPSYVWAADLTNDLAHTGGYTVQLHIDAPVLASPADGGDVERGAAITGTGPASTTIVVKPAGSAAFEVTTDASGAWSFPAPADLGDYAFSVTAKDGFNVSSTNSYTVHVIAAPLLAPVVTSPADGSSVTEVVTEISGTGLPGATVDVTGDATGSGTVKPDGTFTIAVSPALDLGEHTLSVTQESETTTSPAAETTFSVVPAAPVIIAPVPGSTADVSNPPAAVYGTGIDGATVTVTIDGVVLPPVTVEDGKWSAPIGLELAAGAHTVIVTQSVDGVASAAAQSTFTLTGGTVPAGNVDDPGAGGELASTGSDALLPIGVAGGLLVAGAVILMIRRRSLA